jgi:hypothetical protein
MTTFEQSRLQFIRWEESSRDTIDVKRIYVHLAGDLVAGVLLSQIVFWFLPRKDGEEKLSVERDGRLWLAKSREAWWDECCVTPKQVDRCLAELEGRGLIWTSVFRFNGLPTKHVSLNWAELITQLAEGKNEFNQRVKTESTKPPDHSLPLGDPVLTLSANSSNTERTAESTEERNLSPTPFLLRKGGMVSDSEVVSTAEAVCSECRFNSKPVKRAVAVALQMEKNRGEDLAARGKLMVENYGAFVRATEFLKFKWGVVKFIAEGHWLNHEGWPYDEERLHRAREARLGSRR